jgi:hypothetical protein
MNLRVLALLALTTTSCALESADPVDVGVDEEAINSTLPPPPVGTYTTINSNGGASFGGNPCTNSECQLRCLAMAVHPGGANTWQCSFESDGGYSCRDLVAGHTGITYLKLHGQPDSGGTSFVCTGGANSKCPIVERHGPGVAVNKLWAWTRATSSLLTFVNGSTAGTCNAQSHTLILN